MDYVKRVKSAETKLPKKRFLVLYFVLYNFSGLFQYTQSKIYVRKFACYKLHLVLVMLFFLLYLYPFLIFACQTIEYNR